MDLRVSVVIAAALLCCVGLASAQDASGGCANAVYVPPPYYGTQLYGDTRGETGYKNKCSSVNAPDSGSQFYIITPSYGSRVNISTCYPDTQFDTFLAVYTGDDCDDLKCTFVNGDSPSCLNGASFISFKATVDQYWVMVTGYSDREGKYEMTIYEEDVQPPEACTEAVIIQGPYYEPVTLYDTIVDNPVEPLPCDVNSNYGGNW